MNLTDYIANPSPYITTVSTTPYTVLATNGIEQIILVNASGGARTINFYTAVGNAGSIITVKKIDASTNAVTLDPNSTQTIDGDTTVAITARYTSLSCISDGSNWHII